MHETPAYASNDIHVTGTGNTFKSSGVEVVDKQSNSFHV